MHHGRKTKKSFIYDADETDRTQPCTGKNDVRMQDTESDTLASRRISFADIASWAAFIAYCLLMLWLLFGQRAAFEREGTYLDQLSRNFSLLPLRTTALFVVDLLSGDAERVREAIINLGGNVIMFLPLGFLLPCVCKQVDTAIKCLLCTAAVITAVELIQLFTLLGVCDIDDLIFNICGSMLGFGLFRTIKRVAQGHNTTDNM